jgi:hypothetical protein
MVWNATTQKIYALIPSYSALYPNTIAQINPFAGTVETTVQLEGGVGLLEPGALAMSDDGQYLYVGVSDAADSTDHIDRIRTSDLGEDLQIALPATFDTVQTLKVAPGQPHLIAVSVQAFTPLLYIYNDAVADSAYLSGNSGSGFSALAWGGSAGTLYTSLRGNPITIESAAVTASGASVTQMLTSSALSSQFRGDMYYVGSTIFWDGGAAFDPASYTPTTPFTGYASTPNTTSFFAAAFDTTLDRAYFITSDEPANASTYTLAIEGDQLSSRKPLWVARFPSQGSYTAPLIRWGANGLAFVTSSGGSQSLVLISGSLITH